MIYSYTYALSGQLRDVRRQAERYVVSRGKRAAPYFADQLWHRASLGERDGRSRAEKKGGLVAKKRSNACCCCASPR